MKKLLLFTIFSLIFFFSSSAQTCTPDPTINDIVFPNQADDINELRVNDYFEQVFYFKIPTDTALSFGGFDIDAQINNVIIDSVSGIEGFQYSCNPSNCQFPGGSNGCIVYYGTPTEEMSGEIKTINIYGSINASGEFFGNPVDGSIPLDTGFQVEILPADDGSNSVFDVDGKSGFAKVYPNPTNSSALLEVETNATGSLTVSVVNLLGVRVFNESINNYNGSYTKQFNKSELGAGIYFITVNINGEENVSKLIIQ